MAEAVVPVLAGDEVVAYASARATVALVHAWVLRDGRPPWHERGRYPAEVRAAAEQRREKMTKGQETEYKYRLEAVLRLHTGISPWLGPGNHPTGATVCRACSRTWPCATVRAARGEM